MKLRSGRVLQDDEGRPLDIRTGIYPGDPGQMYEGYDHEMVFDPPLTRQERLEIAGRMAEVWAEWAIGESPPAPTPDPPFKSFRDTFLDQGRTEKEWEALIEEFRSDAAALRELNNRCQSRSTRKGP